MRPCAPRQFRHGPTSPSTRSLGLRQLRSFQHSLEVRLQAARQTANDFYELMLVNGQALKALIEEEFGDGIMGEATSTW